MKLLLLLIIPVSLFAQTISIDCGSPTDQYFTGGSPYTIQTPGATGDLTLRYGIFSYSIPAPPGFYDVTLFLRETGTVSGPDQRRFSLSINGLSVFFNYDLYAEAGLAPIQKVYTASSVNGVITLNFTYSARSAIVSRIDISPKPQQVAYPVLQSETIPLSAVPDPVTTLNHTLLKTPVAQLVCFYKSPFVGRDNAVAATAGASNPKLLEIQLPDWPLRAGDSILVLYWTLE